ncbi:MAG TPA: hypothetical protein VJ010_04100 [Actinomycetota bacterium]|nr:hypothetical protein [Actinomycetota bacterium]
MSPRDPARRLGPVAGMVLVALLLAGCSPAPAAPPAAAKADVERAYLAWWSARQAAYLTADPSPLKADAAAAALGADVQRMADLRAAGHVLQLSATHGMQTVVYRDGTTASVDDVWVDHSVELDASTRSPTQPDPDVTRHDSTTLRWRGGRWMVDGVFRFGSSIELPGEAVSYAALAGGRSLPDFYREPIEAAYRKASPKGIEHNERVAIAQDSVAWVYDTTFDGSSVSHSATRLTQASGVWVKQRP